jgi:hypothetical protein
MSLAFFVNSCSDDGTQPSMKELVLENIEANSFVLEEAFAETTEILEAQGDLESLVAKSATRDAFITKMNDLVNDVVKEVAQAHGKIIAWDQVTNSSSIQNNLKQIIVGVDGSSPGTGALELYSKEIDDKLGLLQGELVLVENHLSKQGKQIPIESYSFSTGGLGGQLGSPITDLVIDPFNANRASVKLVKETIGNMTISYSGLEDLDEAIEDFVTNNPDTEVMIQLLLPAILKIREKPASGSTNTNTYTGLTTIAFGTLSLKDKEAWAKKVQYAAFLAAVDFIISENYSNVDENHASIPLQKAMHHAVCVLTWSKIYDLYKR